MKMNITRFLENYSLKKNLTLNDKTWNIPDHEIEELINEHGGLSVDGGIFRIHSYETVKNGLIFL